MLAATLLVLATLALAWPWLTGIVTIPWDAKAHAYAQLQFLARSLHAGDSPFWTPNVFAGSPQIADPQSLIFSPPFLLLAALDADPSFAAADGVVFAMLLAAGLATLMLFRDRGWRPEGGILAAISLAFGGSAAWRLQHIGEVLSLCWFVIALWLLTRALHRGSLVHGLLSGLVAGCMVAGRDQIAYLSMLVLCVHVVWFWFDGTGIFTRLRRSVLPLVCGVAGGIVTGALPIAFSIALAAQSNRPAIDFAGAARGALHPAAFLTGIVANLFGTDGPMQAFWGPPSSLVWGPNDFALARNMGDIYFGALPMLVLLACGVFAGRCLRREIAVVTFCAALLILYALGGYTPFFGRIFGFPGVDLFRRPADATFPLCALLSILAGYCLHLWCAEPRRMPWRLVLVGVTALVALGLCGALALHFGRFDQAHFALLTGVFFWSLAVIALAVLPRWRAHRTSLALCTIAALLTWDLAVSNKPNESTALPPQTYDVLRPDTHNATVVRLKALLAAARPDARERVELAAIDFQWPNIGLVHGFDHDLGYNPIRLALFEDATHAEDQVAVPEQRVFSPLFASYRSPLADLLGLRFIATGVPVEQIDRRLKSDDLTFLGRTEDAYLYENPRALPRVLAPTRAVRADFGAMLKTGVWPDVDFRRTVLLDEVSTQGASPTGDAQASARIVSYGNTRIDIAAEAPDGGGYVVLNDIWHPWWVATVDGEAAPILRANVIFRAVRIPAGAHRVHFAFRPFGGLAREIAERLGLRRPG